MNTRTIIWMILLAIAGIFGIPRLINWVKTQTGEKSETQGGGSSQTHGGETGYAEFDDCQLEVWHSTGESGALSLEALQEFHNLFKGLTLPFTMDGFYILDYWRCDKHHFGAPCYSHFYFQCTKHPTTTKADMVGQLKSLLLELSGGSQILLRVFMQAWLHHPSSQYYQGLYNCKEGSLFL